MNCYKNLVSKILRNDALAKAVLDITKHESELERPSINLVDLDWEKILEEHEDFKNCHFYSGQKPISTDSYHGYEISKNYLFNITVVAECRFLRNSEEYKSKYPQNNYVIINNSEPLAKIAHVMTKNSGIPIADNHKFKFRNCSALSCVFCKEGLTTFKNKGYNVKETNQPCITITKVFDGKDIYNRFHCQLQDSFKNDDFMAILHLRINVRYVFFDKNNGNQKIYRIGGDVTNMIAFDKAKLDLTQCIILGNMINMESDFQYLNEEAQSAADEFNEAQKYVDTNINDEQSDNQWSITNDVIENCDDIDDIVDTSQNNGKNINEKCPCESDSKKLEIHETIYAMEDEPVAKKPRIQESTFSID